MVLIDTAGRMQDNEPLMRALGKVSWVRGDDRGQVRSGWGCGGSGGSGGVIGCGGRDVGGGCMTLAGL